MNAMAAAGRRALAWAPPDLEFVRRLGWWLPPGPVPGPARRPRRGSTLRVGAIVGERLWDGLRHEAQLFLLTPDNWKLMLGHGRLDLLLVESCRETATGHWYQAQSGRAPDSAALAEVLDAAGRAGLPRVYWNTSDHAWHDHYARFARGFDRVFCADEREAEALRAGGVAAEHLEPAVQPVVFNPVRPAGTDAGSSIPLLYDGIVDLLRPCGGTDALRALLGRGLTFIDSHARIFTGRLNEEREAAAALLGCVTQQGRIAALRSARIALTHQDSHLTLTEQRWRSLETAACRVPALHLGALPAGDPRAAYTEAHADLESLCAAIDALQQDDLKRERAAHTAWRHVASRHGFSRRLNVVCRALGIGHERLEQPPVSILTPTYRKERLADCVRTYDSQDYPDKELIIVFNGALEPADIEPLVRGREDIRVLTLPRERHTGACMNAGVAAARGEYCFKMDDDDVYGVHYVADMMLHALAVDADILGKPPAWYTFGADPQLHRRVRPKLPELCEISREQLAGGAVWMSGNSLAGRRRALLAVPFPDTVYSAADTAFLMSLGHSDLRVAMLDSLNLVTSGRPDEAGHTWSARASALTDKLEPLTNTIGDVCA